MSDGSNTNPLYSYCDSNIEDKCKYIAARFIIECK